jgi:hypothetical protein
MSLDESIGKTEKSAIDDAKGVFIEVADFKVLYEMIHKLQYSDALRSIAILEKSRIVKDVKGES